MKRNYEGLLKQIISGVNKYSAIDLDIFKEKRDDVKHGPNGILVTFDGNYGLSINPPQIIGEIVIQVPFETIVLPIPSPPIGLIEKFPYEIGEGIDNILLHPYLFEAGKLKTQAQDKIQVTNPIIHYLKGNSDCSSHTVLLDINTTPKTRRKAKDLLAKIGQFKPQFSH